MKAVVFLGSSCEDLAAFPREARRRAGHELFMVQQGRSPADFKPFSAIGPSVCEIRVKDRAGAFRVMYVATFHETVYVLHAFQKKTRKTAQPDIELAKHRYQSLKDRQ